MQTEFCLRFEDSCCLHYHGKQITHLTQDNDSLEGHWFIFYLLKTSLQLIKPTVFSCTSLRLYNIIYRRRSTLVLVRFQFFWFPPTFHRTSIKIASTQNSSTHSINIFQLKNIPQYLNVHITRDVCMECDATHASLNISVEWKNCSSVPIRRRIVRCDAGVSSIQ